MKKKLKKCLICLLCSSVVLGLAACGNTTQKNNSDDNAKEIKEMNFTFKTDAEGWEGGFADLPIDHEEMDYDVEFKHSDIPNLDSKGLLVTGNNHSDDLFMYVTKKLNEDYGLDANTTYTMNIKFDLATNVPGGMMGIGGSPGSSVYVKAGMTNIKPEPVLNEETNYYRMNINIGSQSNGGTDMTVLGNVEKIDSEDETFQLKSFEHAVEITTNENGEAFVILGVDSGFEGISELYFTNIEISLE